MNVSKKRNIYEWNKLIVRPKGNPMVWVHLVWCIYDGKAELRGVASDQSMAELMSKVFREEFEFGSDKRGNLRILIDEVEVDHGLGSCMTLTALDLDPQLQESRQKYLKMAEENEKRTDEYLTKIKRLAEKKGIL